MYNPRHPSKKMLAQQGYSLVEVLVATFVLAIVMSLVFTVLRQVIDQQQRLKQLAEEHQNLAIAIQMMDQDLAFLQARWYTQDNQLTSPLMIDMEGQQVTFIRLGEDYSTQANVPIKVRYLLSEGHWWRQQSSALSGTFDESIMLLEDVQSWQWQFRDKYNVWHYHWPINEQTMDLPTAIKVTFDFKPYGLVTREIVGYVELAR